MRSPRILLQLALLAGGLALAGCESMGNNGQNQSNNPTTQPQNSAQQTPTDRQQDPANANIGNGAFGEQPPGQ